MAFNWALFRWSWEGLQPFYLLSNFVYCFALARAGYSNPHSLHSSLPKEATESFPFSLYSSPVTEDWKIFPFSVYSSLFHKQGRSRCLLTLSSHRRQPEHHLYAVQVTPVSSINRRINRSRISLQTLLSWSLLSFDRTRQVAFFSCTCSNYMKTFNFS